MAREHIGGPVVFSTSCTTSVMDVDVSMGARLTLSTLMKSGFPRGDPDILRHTVVGQWATSLGHCGCRGRTHKPCETSVMTGVILTLQDCKRNCNGRFHLYNY